MILTKGELDQLQQFDVMMSFHSQDAACHIRDQLLLQS